MERKITQTQMTLDFGQTQSRNMHCKQCGMFYSKCCKDDVKAHSLFHKKMVMPVIKIKRGRHQKILEDHFDGFHVSELLVNDGSNIAIWHRLSAIMSRDLGYDNPLATPYCSPTALSSLFPIHSDWRIILCIADLTQQVVGCCIAEELTGQSMKSKGYQISCLHVTKCCSSLKFGTDSDSNMIACPKHSSPVIGPLCGIRRLWVDKRNRRRGVASRMVNCILKNLVYGHVLSTDQVAFAEPTDDGVQFATAFLKTEDFLIY